MFSRPVQRLATGARPSDVAAPAIAGPEAVSAAPVIAHSIGTTLPVAPPERTNRTGLPDDLKHGIEALSGIALDDVRVHRNSAQPARLGAHAHAQGSHIHLAQGQERHLPHEAWHVVQQKQGRVRATVQLNGGVSVNDDAALEREADAMGARAMRGIDAHRTSLTLGATSAMAPLQAVWVIRGGQWKWVEDHQRQQSDETPAAFTQRPEVILAGGTTSAAPDAAGTMHVDPHGEVEQYDALKKRRFDQGKALRARLLKNPKAIQGQIDELRGTAEQLEKVAPDSLPDEHEDKVTSLLDGGTLTPGQFRNVIKGQDEYTQSSGSANFINGLRTRHSSESGEHDKLVEEYAAHTFRVMSGLRAPTQSIVAAINHGGTIVGSRHPTTDDQPKIEHGGSAHAYNDRWRSQKQADVFDAASHDPDAPANAVLNAANFTGALATLHNMSWPASATNVATPSPLRAAQQTGERDLIKVQANVVGRTIGIAAPNDRQALTDPLKPYLDRPTSPFRTDENSLLYHQTLGIALNSKAASFQQSTSSSPSPSASLSLSSSSSQSFGGHSNIVAPTPLLPPSHSLSLGGSLHATALPVPLPLSPHFSTPLFGAQSHILSDDPPSSLWEDAPDALVDDEEALERAKRPRDDDALDQYDKRPAGMTDEEAKAEVRKYLTKEWH